MEYFDRDDAGYLAWLQQHPDGFVLNAGNMSDPNTRLHRAECFTIVETPPNGKPELNAQGVVPNIRTGIHEKACSQDKVELINWAKMNRKGRVEAICLKCNP